MNDNPFNKIMSTRKASELWGINQDSIKRMAREGRIIARKLDKGDPSSPYLILKEQPNPRNKT